MSMSISQSTEYVIVPTLGQPMTEEILSKRKIIFYHSRNRVCFEFVILKCNVSPRSANAIIIIGDNLPAR